jgi:hypothetical protein
MGKAQARPRGEARGVERWLERMVAELARGGANGIRRSLRARGLRRGWLFIVGACMRV